MVRWLILQTTKVLTICVHHRPLSLGRATGRPMQLPHTKATPNALMLGRARQGPQAHVCSHHLFMDILLQGGCPHKALVPTSLAFLTWLANWRPPACNAIDHGRQTPSDVVVGASENPWRRGRQATTPMGCGCAFSRCVPHWPARQRARHPPMARTSAKRACPTICYPPPKRAPCLKRFPGQ